jgi:diguanylate cyclase (GGDEF)-like protein
MAIALPAKSLSLSIKTSLLTSIFLLLVILGGVSIMAKMRMSALQDTIETVGRDRLPKLRELGEVNLMVTRVRSASTRVPIAATPEQRADVVRSMEARVAELDRKIRQVQDGMESGTALRLIFDQFASKWAQYLAKHHSRVVDPQQVLDPVRYSHIVNVETSEHYNAAVDIINDGIKLANQEADQIIDDALGQSRFYATMLWLVNGASVLIGLVTLIFVVRDVSAPIHRITSSMESIASGKLETEIPYADRENELGMMARALVVFRKSLVENDRLNAATRTLSELSEWLQTAKSETELYGMISSVLGRLMPDCKGGLFTYANSRDVLDIAAEWNGVSETRSFHPDDCWSLRRGHPYVHGTSEIEFHCEHVHDGVNDNYCCVPILAHGETVGLLHLEYLGGEQETVDEARARFADRVRLGMACAEHLSIAIANMKLREGLRDQSVRDVLTGLNNRRYLMEAARKELARAERDGHPVSLIVLDVDHFKTFNDNHGHDAGDTVLRHIGEALQAVFADDALPCRFGGEEFVALLPGVDIDAATARAEALRARIESLKIRYADGHLPPVTISAGVAAYPTFGANLAELLKSADAALYEAKRAGRNRIVIAGRSPVDDAVRSLQAILHKADPNEGARPKGKRARAWRDA